MARIQVPKTYIDKNVATTVDWGAITDQFNTQLKAEELRRNQLKDEIETNSRSIAKTLDDAPLGNHAGMKLY